MKVIAGCGHPGDLNGWTDRAVMRRDSTHHRWSRALSKYVGKTVYLGGGGRPGLSKGVLESVSLTEKNGHKLVKVRVKDLRSVGSGHALNKGLEGSFEGVLGSWQILVK
ncbi:MAG: hypothetical protein WC554_07960 [Clostridia bacterium]|jgi:hypothetical protein